MADSPVPSTPSGTHVTVSPEAVIGTASYLPQPDTDEGSEPNDGTE